jgi:adenylate cyclase
MLGQLVKKRTLIVLSLLLTVLYVYAVYLNSNTVFLRYIENIAYDIRLNLTLPNVHNEQVIILDIDEKSLAEEGRWPWPRDRIAELVNRLFEDYEIAVLGFDVVFAEKDSDPGLMRLASLAQSQLEEPGLFIQQLDALTPQIDRDQQLASSLLERPVVLGYYFQNQHHMHHGLKSGQLPFPVLPIEEAGLQKLPFIKAEGYGANIAVLQENAIAGGYFDNPDWSGDGVIRSVPLVTAFEGNLYESLALATARVYLDSFFIEPVITTDQNGQAITLEGIKINDLTVPVNDHAIALIPYLGRQGSFSYYSVSDVLQGKIDKRALAGKIILIGTTSPGLQDLRATPMQSVYPGVEVHANLIAGILDQRIKYKPGYSVGISLVQLLSIGLLMSLLLPFLSAGSSIILALLLSGLLTGYNLYSWNHGLVLPIASSLLLIILLFVLHMAYGFITENRQKRIITQTFGQYVPPGVVQELAENPDLSDLSGQSRDMTVLFSDVRGFTSLSENLTPRELTQVMNAILTPITRIIYEHGGTIDKYMGDAVMAFWGAPLDNPLHANHALQAAMQMTDALSGINEDFNSKGWPSIDMGIGLNSGTMNVGNMGSEYRVAYTVLGDAVNLGSRLEGLTKQYGVRIVVSEFTRDAAADFIFRELDRVRVKGKEEPVTIYEPVGTEDSVSEEMLSEIRQYHAALELYRAQQWHEAESAFNTLAEKNHDLKIYQLYLERINQYQQTPPDQDWDGVYTFTTK